MRGRLVQSVVTGIALLLWFMLLTPVVGYGGESAARAWLMTLAVWLVSRAGLRVVQERNRHVRASRDPAHQVRPQRGRPTRDVELADTPGL